MQVESPWIWGARSDFHPPAGTSRPPRALGKHITFCWPLTVLTPKFNRPPFFKVNGFVLWLLALTPRLAVNRLKGPVHRPHATPSHTLCNFKSAPIRRRLSKPTRIKYLALGGKALFFFLLTFLHSLAGSALSNAISNNLAYDADPLPAQPSFVRRDNRSLVTLGQPTSYLDPFVRVPGSSPWNYSAGLQFEQPHEFSRSQNYGLGNTLCNNPWNPWSIPRSRHGISTVVSPVLGCQAQRQ
jgi:hypothetical protein